MEKTKEENGVHQHEDGVDVTTYVLYSGQIKHPVTVIKTGANIYQVIPIIMQEDSADDVIRNLQKKLNKHEQIEKMVYAMADKFLDSGDLEKIKEEIKMTRLGTMLYEDGIEVGIELGEKQKLKSQIEKKLKRGYTVDEIADMLEEDIEEVRQLITELL